MTGANYSTTSDELLCKTCKFGHVVESSNGNTAVLCHCKVESESAVPLRLDMLVTKCSRYEHPQLLRIWDTALSVHIEDGHCWLDSQRYVPELGHVTLRADTVGRRYWIFKERPDRPWDSAEGHFVGEQKPVGHRVAKWWRRLQAR